MIAPDVGGGSDLGSAFSNLSSATDNLSAAASGGGGRVQFDPDAAQAIVKTWDSVIEELQACAQSAGDTGLGNLLAPASDQASGMVMSRISDSFSRYSDYIADLLKKSIAEQQKLQDAIKAYRQNDASGAATANHIQG